MAGISCHVYLPSDANNAKVELSKKLGAQVTKVKGTISEAGRYAANAAEKTGAYNASTFVTPFRHDGKGTMALEICEQRGWESPDCVVYPVEEEWGWWGCGRCSRSSIVLDGYV